MNRREHLLLLLAAAVAMLASCASTPKAPSRQVVQPSAPHAAEASPAAPQAGSTSPQASQPGGTSASPSATHAAAGKQNELIQKGNIKVTEAYYEQTLDDVRILIATLNTIIRNGDFNAWLTYLTPGYIAQFSDPSTLAALSQSPLLQKEGIRLRSLKDYFTYVVVPSRTDAQVDDIDFISKQHVRAIAVINGQRYILYDLRLDGGSWKIGV